jgi:hypothetical protein
MGGGTARAQMVPDSNAPAYPAEATDAGERTDESPSGDITYDPKGTFTQKISGIYYNSDGTFTQRSGDLYYKSDGTVCNASERSDCT